MADAHGAGGDDELDPKKRKLEQRLEKLSSQLKESLDELTKANKKVKNKKSRVRFEGLGQSSESRSGTSSSGSRKPVAIYGFGDEEKRRLRNEKQREWYAARKDNCASHTSVGKDSTADAIGSFDDDDIDDADNNRIIDETEEEEDHVPATCVDEGIQKKNDFERGLWLLRLDCKFTFTFSSQSKIQP